MKRILIIAFLLISAVLKANNFYVDDDAVDDLGVGTIGDPFKTITHGESHLVAGRGDTLFVRTGNYDENVIVLGCAGTALAPTVITNYPAESPVIYGHLTDPSLGGYGVLLWLTDYIVFNGFEIVNTSAGMNVSGQHCIVSNCTVHDTWNSGITLRGDYSICDNCTVYNNSMINENLAHPSGWGNAITAGRDQVDNITEYAIIRHCTVYDSWGEGIVLKSGRHGIIEDCIVYDVLTPCYYILNHEYALVQRNLAYRTKYMGPASSGFQTGIGHWDETIDVLRNKYNTIINNIVYGCNRNLLCGSMDNSIIANNTFANSNYYASVQFTSNLKINAFFENNIIVQQDAVQCIYYAPYSGDDITFSNNLYNKAYDADAVGAGDVTGDPTFTETGGDSTQAVFYKLDVGSPAINAGLDVGIYVDYGENLRSAVPDIGAWEGVASEAPQLPSATTGGVSAWTNGATSYSNVIDDGGGTLTAAGVCWDTSANPDLTDDHTDDITTEGIFSIEITGLTAGTTYYLRAYATNEIGTAYGMNVEFTTSEFGYVFDNDKVIFHEGKIIYIE